MFVFLGAFAAHNNFTDIIVTVIFGVVGYLMVLFQWPRPPFVLGLVLGTIVENYLWISSSAYGAAWLMHPTVVCLFLLMVGTLIYSVVQTRKGRSLEESARKSAEGTRE
jgi:TctA family transporter